MKINRVEKLVPNLNDERNYVVHIKALNRALKHGLIIEKVRVIEFNQSVWLKSCIDFNTQLRTQAKNDFEDIKLVSNRESYLKTVMKPNLKSTICFGENLMGC